MFLMTSWDVTSTESFYGTRPSSEIYVDRVVCEVEEPQDLPSGFTAVDYDRLRNMVKQLNGGVHEYIGGRIEDF